MNSGSGSLMVPFSRLSRFALLLRFVVWAL